MKNNGISEKNQIVHDEDFFGRLWGKSWTLVKTVVDVVREPVLILDKELVILAANENFYTTFKVNPGETKGKLVYSLGNGQWDIPALRKLLTEIVTYDHFFKGFQVAHEFPTIGRRVMVLNARQIYIKDDQAKGDVPPIIVLAIEDVTDMMAVAEELAQHAKRLEGTLLERIGKLEDTIQSIQKK